MAVDDGAPRLYKDLAIRAEDRKYHWPLGRWPDDHPSLSSFVF
jgi:uncharacterized protein